MYDLSGVVMCGAGHFPEALPMATLPVPLWPRKGGDPCGPIWYDERKKGEDCQVPGVRCEVSGRNADHEQTAGFKARREPSSDT